MPSRSSTGRELEVDGDGFWVGLTLFDEVTADMAIYRNEIFGPVVSVVRVDTLEEAIAPHQRQLVR